MEEHYDIEKVNEKWSEISKKAGAEGKIVVIEDNGRPKLAVIAYGEYQRLLEQDQNAERDDWTSRVEKPDLYSRLFKILELRDFSQRTQYDYNAICVGLFKTYFDASETAHFIMYEERSLDIDRALGDIRIICDRVVDRNLKPVSFIIATDGEIPDNNKAAIISAFEKMKHGKKPNTLYIWDEGRLGRIEAELGI
jgi:hypothetical protein